MHFHNLAPPSLPTAKRSSDRLRPGYISCSFLLKLYNRLTLHLHHQPKPFFPLALHPFPLTILSCIVPLVPMLGSKFLLRQISFNISPSPPVSPQRPRTRLYDELFSFLRSRFGSFMSRIKKPQAATRNQMSDNNFTITYRRDSDEVPGLAQVPRETATMMGDVAKERG